MWKVKRTDSPDEYIKRPILNVRRAPKVNQLNVLVPIKNDILVLDIPVDDLRTNMQMEHSFRDLDKYPPRLVLLHVATQLDIIKQIHAR
jgi:hypothetical protein